MKLAVFAVIRTGFLAVIFTCALAFAAHAQSGGDEPEGVNAQHLEDVEELLELMGMPEQVNAAANRVLAQYSATVDEGNTDADLRKLVDAYQMDLEKIILPVLDWDGLKTTYIYSYSKRLNKKEVAKITKFYQSKAGQKFVSIQPESSAEIEKITRHLVESDIQEPLNALTRLFREGLAKHKTLKAAE